MVNKIITGLAIAVVLSIIYVGNQISNDFAEKRNKEADSEKIEETEVVEAFSETAAHENIVGVEEPNVEAEKDFEDLLTLDLNEETTEEMIQTIIHQMSHQKVMAEAKRGKIPLTKTTASELQDFLQSSIAEGFTHIDTYRNISSKWVEGDFSAVHDDHNAIWELQSGEIGYATETMSIVDEQAYMYHNYGHEFYEFLIETGELVGH